MQQATNAIGVQICSINERQKIFSARNLGFSFMNSPSDERIIKIVEEKFATHLSTLSPLPYLSFRDLSLQRENARLNFDSLGCFATAKGR